ncbi:Rid family hydrolase [Candidatus Latescibacterota bacterium]
MNKCGLSEDTQLFCRFYLGDIANQIDILHQSPIYRTASKGAVSIIQQRPVNGSSVNLFAYHIKGKNDNFTKKYFSFDSDKWSNGALIHGTNYDLLWTANFSGKGAFDTQKQTNDLFQSYNMILNRNGMNLIDNAVRTWVYVRDIDNHYIGMVEARKAFLEAHGLNVQTRYIASTGIEGITKEANSLVSLDTLSIKNITQEQIVPMKAIEYLPSTIEYGVTFERGIRVRFGDRSHLYISGTASIDKNGKIMHISDVQNQTLRTLENIRALLASHDADLKDLAYLIIYIRNFKDKNRVMTVLEKEIPPNIPFLFVEAAICRPAWLVELEGMGIISDSNDYPVFL